jgi:methylthioribulose-1-phosphate dehydratase
MNSPSVQCIVAQKHILSLKMGMATMGFEAACDAIIAVGRWLDTKGWAPATAGNYSMRLDDGSFAVTVSGQHKGRLSREDVMRVDATGQSLDGKKPSAETGLHLAIYALFPHANAVLHSHSPEAVGLTRAHPDMAAYRLAGHEMLKVLPGITTHDTAIAVPVVDNAQDMAVLAAAVQPALLAPGAVPAYLIRSHGLYGWGATMAEAERVVEGIEWMIAAELAEARFRSA